MWKVFPWYDVIMIWRAEDFKCFFFLTSFPPWHHLPLGRLTVHKKPPQHPDCPILHIIKDEKTLWWKNIFPPSITSYEYCQWEKMKLSITKKPVVDEPPDPSQTVCFAHKMTLALHIFFHFDSNWIWFFPNDPNSTDYKSSLVQRMAWCLTSDKPLLTKTCGAIWCHWATMVLM